MNVLYNFGILIFRFLVFLASFFDRKIAALWRGSRYSFEVLRAKLDPSDSRRYIWIHAASLGEFEQGRPIIERIRAEHPEYKILLTFFSPSGYEVQKSYALADIVCYLPLDTYGNAHRFVKMVNPAMAIFIKYEFWANYLHCLRRAKVPTYVVSAIFRPEQAFFRWYGGWYRGLLRHFTTIFVQDETSRRLLADYHITNVLISGDTRFDRVHAIASHPKQIPHLEEFIDPSRTTLIAGSSWEKDEELFIEYFNDHPGIKLIIAPHVISRDHIFEICSRLRRPFIRYSECSTVDLSRYDCLIIDAIGFLSSIYRVGQIAYVGGGFGVGIHNTLEPAVYGMPVLFGPNYDRFKEAVDLVECGAAFPVDGYESLSRTLDRLILSPEALREASDKAARYVSAGLGGTRVIMDEIFPA